RADAARAVARRSVCPVKRRAAASTAALHSSARKKKAGSRRGCTIGSGVMNKEWTISQAMRARLTINRDGRLTSEQWKDLVTEPLVILLLVLAPLILILGPRLVALALRGWVLALVVVLLVVVVPIIARAWRYARLPVHFA